MLVVDQMLVVDRPALTLQQRRDRAIVVAAPIFVHQSRGQSGFHLVFICVHLWLQTFRPARAMKRCTGGADERNKRAAVAGDGPDRAIPVPWTFRPARIHSICAA